MPDSWSNGKMPLPKLGFCNDAVVKFPMMIPAKSHQIVNMIDFVQRGINGEGSFGADMANLNMKIVTADFADKGLPGLLVDLHRMNPNHIQRVQVMFPLGAQLHSRKCSCLGIKARLLTIATKFGFRLFWFAAILTRSFNFGAFDIFTVVICGCARMVTKLLAADVLDGLASGNPNHFAALKTIIRISVIPRDGFFACLSCVCKTTESLYLLHIHTSIIPQRG
jgi:hypothetical protein